MTNTETKISKKEEELRCIDKIKKTWCEKSSRLISEHIDDLLIKMFSKKTSAEDVALYKFEARVCGRMIRNRNR